MTREERKGLKELELDAAFRDIRTAFHKHMDKAKGIRITIKSLDTDEKMILRDVQFNLDDMKRIT